jgi:large subunit ribosomal protein L4
VKNVFDYFLDKDRYNLKKTKDFGDVAGSGKKPYPQKGKSASRQGNKRAPQLNGGGVTHGPVPRCLGFSINNKMRLLALKTSLSAKLFKQKLIFIDTEALEFPKTQLLSAIVEPYGIDKFCFLKPTETDVNFKLVASNIQNVNLKSP